MTSELRRGWGTKESELLNQPAAILTNYSTMSNIFLHVGNLLILLEKVPTSRDNSQI
jgi:hypothetical protein